MIFVNNFYESLLVLSGSVNIHRHRLSSLQLFKTAHPRRLCSLFEIKYPNIMCIYYYHVKYHIWCVCTWVEYKAIDNFIASFMKISLYSPNKKRRFGTTIKAGLCTLANSHMIMSRRPGGVSPWCHSPPLSPMSRARAMTCCDPGGRPPAWSASASLGSRDLEANKYRQVLWKLKRTIHLKLTPESLSTLRAFWRTLLRCFLVCSQV